MEGSGIDQPMGDNNSNTNIDRSADNFSSSAIPGGSGYRLFHRQSPSHQIIGGGTGMGKLKLQEQIINDKLLPSQSTAHQVLRPTTPSLPLPHPITTSHSVSQPTTHPPPLSHPMTTTPQPPFSNPNITPCPIPKPTAHSIPKPATHSSPLSHPIITTKTPPLTHPTTTTHTLPNDNFSSPSSSTFQSISNHFAGSRQSIHKKRGRGPALGIPTWGTGERFHVDFNSSGFPTGKGEQQLMGQLGLLARNGFKLPLTFVRWTDVPNDILDGLWREVQENTDVPSNYRNKCLHVIGERWRAWKYHIKRGLYDIYETDEERLAIVPDRVVVDQWKTLVRYWGKQTVKAMSRKNSNNRKKLKGNHRMGRSSFRSIRQKMESEGKKTDRIHIYIRTRTNKKGKIDHDARKVIEEMNKLLKEVPEEEHTVEYIDSCFTRVMGEDGHGHARIWGSRMDKNNLSSSLIHEEIELIRSQLREEMQSHFDAKLAQMKAQMKIEMEELLATNMGPISNTEEATRVDRTRNVTVVRAAPPIRLVYCRRGGAISV